MPINRPFASELKTAIEQYRENPDSDPRVDGYYQKILAHLEALLARESELGDAFASGEAARLTSTAALLNLPDDALETVCTRLAGGKLDDVLPVIVELWLPLAREKLEIDSPRYRK